jgi:hypothetical protein
MTHQQVVWINEIGRTPVAHGSGPVVGLLFGFGFAAIGCVLALDVRGIATILHRNTSESAPWGRNRDFWHGLNPFRIAGCVFAGVGVIILIVVAVRGH